MPAIEIYRPTVLEACHPESLFVPLTPKEAEVLAVLKNIRPEAAEQVILFTDPFRDPDDLNVLASSPAHAALGFATIDSAVVTHGNKAVLIDRALGTKRAFIATGRPNIPVCVGGDCPIPVGKEDDHNTLLPHDFCDADPIIIANDPIAFLRKRLEQAVDGSLTLAVIAGNTDLEALLKDKHFPGTDGAKLIQRKVKQVIVMGGVEVKEDGSVVADTSSYNNASNQAAADFVCTRLQELGIPQYRLRKDAAYAAAVATTFYNDASATNHPIGKNLHDVQMQSLAKLLNNILEGNAPSALTVEWFFSTFTNIDAKNDSSPATQERFTAVINEYRSSGDLNNILKHVAKLNQYDPLTFMMASPNMRELFFEPKLVSDPSNGLGAVYHIGADELKAPDLARAGMAALLKVSLRGPVPQLVTSDKPKKIFGSKLWKMGANCAVDQLTTRIDPQSEKLQLLLITRKDGSLAMPRGFIDKNETPYAACLRVQAEELNGFGVKPEAIIHEGFTADPGNTRIRWIETTVFASHLSAEQSDVKVTGSDDAQAGASFMDVSYDLVAKLYGGHPNHVILGLVRLAETRDDLSAIARGQIEEVLKCANRDRINGKKS